MNEEIIRRAGEIIGKNTAKNAPEGAEPYCVLALMDDGCGLTASAITAANAEGIAWIAFCTGLQSNKAKRIEKSDRASVCFCGADHNITLTGRMEIVTDEAVKREMWYEGLKNHFRGADDPDYCVLRFHTEHYNLLVDWKEARGTYED
jgi:general stress protein 26